MRHRWIVGALIALAMLVGGCGPELPSGVFSCADEPCPDAMTCASDDLCYAELPDTGPPTDSGPRPDRMPIDGGSDSGPMDSGRPDSGPDCNDLCGDLDQNGVVSVEDRAILQMAISDAVVLDDCTQPLADVFMDGALTAADEKAFVWSLPRPEGPICSPCEDNSGLMRECGDVNSDGNVNNTDAIVLAGSPDPANACDFWTYDVDGNGDIDEDDATTLLEYLTAGGMRNCAETAP